MLVKSLQAPLAIALLLSTAAFCSQAKATDYLINVVRPVLDTSGRIIQGTVTSSGDIVDSSGRIVGHAVVGSLDSTGNIIDPSGRTITRVTTTTSTPTSTTVYTTASPAPPVVMTETLATVIDDRRLELAKMIEVAYSSGSISAFDAGDFRRSLARIESAEIAAKASGGYFAYDEATDVARDLDSLATKVATASRLTPFSPLIIVTEAGVVRFNIAPSGYYTTMVAPTTTMISTAPSSETTVTRTVATDGTTITRTTETPAFPNRVVEETRTTTTTSPGTLISTPMSSAIVTTSSPVVYVQTISPALYVTTLDTRRSDLYKLVADARQRGLISHKQADLMLSELDRVQRETNTTLSYGRAVLLARDLDMIGVQIATVVSSVPQPIIAGSHLTISNGQLLTMDDVAVRRSDLEGRIAKDYLVGRLSPNRADELRQRMNAIDTMEANFRQHGGDLTLKESRMLYSNYDKVASDLDKFAGKENQ
jgi:hypothetical protein